VLAAVMRGAARTFDKGARELPSNQSEEFIPGEARALPAIAGLAWLEHAIAAAAKPEAGATRDAGLSLVCDLCLVAEGSAGRTPALKREIGLSEGVQISHGIGRDAQELVGCWRVVWGLFVWLTHGATDLITV